MKSKICLCNGTILRKDMTRFAPLVLAVGLVLWGMGSLLGSMVEYLDPSEIPETVTMCLIPAMILAEFSAVFLFGYLAKKKECDYIHTLPLRRETLFFTKILGGFLQFVVPFGIFYAFFPGDRGWGFQMLVTFCGWLFLFGVTAFVMMLSGRKLAAVILVSLLLDLPACVYEVIESLYVPMLPGVYLGKEPEGLSPISYMMNLNFEEGTAGEILVPMGICALVGVVFLGAALVAYRKRRLERAGDFLAVRWLEPVLAWGLGIYGALITSSIAYMLEAPIWIPLVLGLAIGYFAARMLFARSVKVFSLRNLAGFTVLAAVMFVSLFLTALDPLHIVDRVPAAEKIESVSIYDGEYILYAEYGDVYQVLGCTVTDPAEIGEIRQMHQNLLKTNIQEVEGVQSYHNRYYLVYHLKNGTQVCRTYYILDGQELKTLKYYMSQPESLVGTADIEELLGSLKDLHANGVNGGTIHTQRAFLEVFLSECEAGWMYTPDPDGQSTWDVQFYTEELGYWVVDIPLTAQKTIAWLENYFGSQG